MGPFDNELWGDKTGQFFAKSTRQVDFAFELADDFGRHRLSEPSQNRFDQFAFSDHKKPPQTGAPCR
jgi:hypothetical protein